MADPTGSDPSHPRGRSSLRPLGDRPSPPSQPPRPHPAQALVALAAAALILLLLPLVRIPAGPGADDPPLPTTTSVPASSPGRELSLPLLVGMGREPHPLVGELPGQTDHLALGDDLLPVDLTSDGLIVGLEGPLRQPVLVDGTERHVLSDRPSSRVLLSPHGGRLAILDAVGRASVWESSSGAVLLDRGPHRSLHWSPDSRLLGLQTSSGYQVWDVDERRLLADRPGRILALGPDRAAVWRDGLLLIEVIGGRVEHGFPALSPSTTADVPGGAFDPTGGRLVLPALAEDGPGLFLLDPTSPSSPERLTRGEVTRPLFVWSGDGRELSWVDGGRLWLRTETGEVRDLGPVPGELRGLRLYDAALVPTGTLLLPDDGRLVERSPLAHREFLRSSPGTSTHLVQVAPDLALEAIARSGTVSIRTVQVGLRSVTLADFPKVETLEAALSPDGTWALVVDGGLRVIAGGRQYGPIDLGTSPGFAGEVLVYTDGEEILSIDTTRIPLSVVTLLELEEVPGSHRFLGVGAAGGRIVALVETENGSSRLLAFPSSAAAAGENVAGAGPEGLTDLETFATPDPTLVVSPDRSLVGVQLGPDRAAVVGSDRPLFLTGMILGFSPRSHWVLVAGSGEIQAVSTRGRGRLRLPGPAPARAVWLEG